MKMHPFSRFFQCCRIEFICVVTDNFKECILRLALNRTEFLAYQIVHVNHDNEEIRIPIIALN
jgi:hypothetical protein